MGRRTKSRNKKTKSNETKKENCTKSCSQLEKGYDSLDEMDELLSEEGPDIKYTGAGK